MVKQWLHQFSLSCWVTVWHPVIRFKLWWQLVAIYLVFSSWASLTSAMAGAFSTSITVDHLYGLVALLLQALKTKAKHFMSLSLVAPAKHSWSLRVSPSWMLISFHFADTSLATSFIRSDSSGSLSSPAYLLRKPASEEPVKIMKRKCSNTHYTTVFNKPNLWMRERYFESTKLKDICNIISCKPYLIEQAHFLKWWTRAFAGQVERNLRKRKICIRVTTELVFITATLGKSRHTSASIKLSLEQTDHYLVMVVALLQEERSEKNWRDFLPQLAPLCVPVVQAASASHSTPHAADKRALDDQVQTYLPAVWWSVGNVKVYTLQILTLVTAVYSQRLTPGYVCGVIVHPLSSTSPSFGISRVICSSSNITSWSGPTLAATSVYLASIAYSKKHYWHTNTLKQTWCSQ